VKKHPPPGQCVYCLECHDELTWDHILPRSWYPDTTPSDVEKWKVPCCVRCNSAYGRLEEDLLVRLGLCLNSEDFRCAGVPQAVMRSLTPKVGRDEADSEIRARRRSKIKNQVVYVSDASRGILPGFGDSVGAANAPRAAVLLPKQELVRFGEKLLRGIVFRLSGKVIDHSQDIGVHFCEPGRVTYVNALLRHGDKHELGPGLSVVYAVAKDNDQAQIVRVTIWDKWVLYYTAMPRADVAQS